MGAFLHDMGKIDELSYDRGFAYTDEGQLIGHLVMAVGTLGAESAPRPRNFPANLFPAETVLRLKHMIVSHHGEYEFGSPKLPMTLEAVALHLLDNLDAKLHSFHLLMRDDPNVDSPWTTYHANLGRKFYKGSKVGLSDSLERTPSRPRACAELSARTSRACWRNGSTSRRKSAVDLRRLIKKLVKAGKIEYGKNHLVYPQGRNDDRDRVQPSRAPQRRRNERESREARQAKTRHRRHVSPHRAGLRLRPSAGGRRHRQSRHRHLSSRPTTPPMPSPATSFE